jgi:hypothetical protein
VYSHPRPGRHAGSLPSLWLIALPL